MSRKIIIAIVIVVLLIFMVRAIQPKPATPVVTTPASTTTSPTSENDGVFTNGTFSFHYPKDLIAKDYNETSPWRINSEAPGTSFVTISIPKSTQPNTNFSEAKFTVGMSTEASAIRDCLVETNGERLKGTVVINGTTFTKFTLTGAGMSNYYDTVSYRTMHNNNCYAVEHTIHSTAIGVYPPELGIKEFDTAAVVRALDGMVQSFVFLR